MLVTVVAARNLVSFQYGITLGWRHRSGVLDRIHLPCVSERIPGEARSGPEGWGLDRWRLVWERPPTHKRPAEEKALANGRLQVGCAFTVNGNGNEWKSGPRNKPLT